MIPDLVIGLVLTSLALVGFLFNIYIVLALVLTKQTWKPSSLLLVHLGLSNSLLTLLFLFFSAPTILMATPVAGTIMCQVHGFMVHIINPLIVWNIAGIHLERFVAIAHPLRYATILTCRRMGLFLLVAWILVLVSSIPPLFGVCPLRNVYLIGQAACLPDFTTSIAYPIVHVFIGVIIPLILILAWNMHIVTIAKYHQFRIANAIFKMTFSHLNMSANEKRRQDQNTALKRFQGFNAVITLSQLIGTIVIFNSPFYTHELYQALAGDTGSPVVSWLCLFLLMCSPVSNGFVYGIKSKTIQMTFVHFARRQIYKSEVHREIQQRSPISGSRRPSLSSMISSTLGNNTLVTSQLHRRLSDVASLKRPLTPAPNMNRSKSTKCFRRHASDLAWRPLIQSGKIQEIVGGLDSRKRSESAYFHPFPNLSRDNTLKSSKNSLDVRDDSPILHNVDVDDSDSINNEDSGFTSIKGNFGRQSTSNSLQIPGDMSKPVTEPDDSENEIDTLPDSSDGENISSRNASRNHSLTSSGISSNRASLTPTKTNLAIGATLKQLLTVSRSNSRDSKDRPKIMITRVPTIDQSDMDFVYGDEVTCADATNGYKSDTEKEKGDSKKCTRGKLEREQNIDAEKRCLKRGIRISLERSDSFDEEYIADYITKLPLDGQYQPLSSIEECVTPLPPMQMEDTQECPTLGHGVSLDNMSMLNQDLSRMSCDDDVTLYLEHSSTSDTLVDLGLDLEL